MRTGVWRRPSANSTCDDCGRRYRSGNSACRKMESAHRPRIKAAGSRSPCNLLRSNLEDSASFLFTGLPSGRRNWARSTQVPDSHWLTTGPAAPTLRTEFANTSVASTPLLSNPRTAALQLALDAIGLQPGDEVLYRPTPSPTAGSGHLLRSLSGVVRRLPGGFNIDPADVGTRITRATTRHHSGAYCR